MRAKRTRVFLPFALLLGVAALGTEAQARVSGELVEPDVMLLIDTSGSMDWLPNTPLERNEWDYAREQCLEDLVGNERSSWHTLQNAFLGSINSADYHCTVEPPAARPNLHGGVDKTNPDWYVPENTADFRNSNYHFRAVSCPADKWLPGPDGFGQCIDDIGNNYLGNTAKCYNEDSNADNNPTGKGAGSDLYKDFCFNQHPESTPRQPNGILQGYSSDVRFGIMTFDNVPRAATTACGVRSGNYLEPNTDWENRWDYGNSRHWNCGEYATNYSPDMTVNPGDVCECWNAGARESTNDDIGQIFGGVVRFGDPLITNPLVQGVMQSMEPNLCSPLGSMIDDVGYFFANEKSALPAFSDGPPSGLQDFRGSDVYYRCRPKIVVLVTDGQPTPAFEFAAGACGNDTHWKPWTSASDALDKVDPTDPDSDLYLFDCPWRSSPEEAGELFALGTEVLYNVDTAITEDDQPIYLVVVGFNVPDVEDCSATPDKCIPYTAAYNDRRCYVPECGTALADGGVGAVSPETQCLMTPREFLNEIACKGWPWDPATPQEYNTAVTPIEPPWIDEICGTTDDDLCNINKEERALFVNNDASKLASVISMVIGTFNKEIATRTDVVTWNVPRTSNVRGAAAPTSQYEFRSGYISKSDGKWEGVLTSQGWTCGEETACDPTTSGRLQKSNLEADIKNMGALLALQSTRKLLSFRPDRPSDPADPVLDSTDYESMPPTDLLKYATMGCSASASGCPWELKPIDSASAFDDCDFGMDNLFALDKCVGNHTIQNETAEYLEERGLADIYSSNPAVLGPPVARLNVPSYTAFKSSVPDREPFLYVGSNDGVLHSFDIFAVEDETPTIENWGYVPYSILDNVREQFPINIMDLGAAGYALDTSSDIELYRHMFLLDGSPIAQDVLMIRESSASINADEEKDYWRSVVFGGLGKEGARGYYALDVTEAAQDATKYPWFRWEINPDDGLYANNECDPDADDDNCDHLDKIGYPISKPALAYLRYATGSNTYFSGAAAILPGGWKADPNPNASNPKEAGNTGVYLVRLGDGHLIRYLDPGNPDDICEYSDGSGGTTKVGLEGETNSGVYSLKEGAQIVGEPVVAGGSRTINFATEAYVGDDRGRLWIVDFKEEDPKDWCLSIYFDTLISWHFPYQNCIDSTCTEQDLSDFPYDDRCVDSPAPGICLSDDLYRNMKGPRVMMMGAPTIAMAEDESTRELTPVLIFGTGQYDSLPAWNRNRIFSVTDRLVNGHHEAEINWVIGDFGEVKGSSDFPNVLNSEFPTSSVNWYSAQQNEMRNQYVAFDDYTASGTDRPNYFYNVGEKLIGRPVVFDKVAYFTTFVPIEDGYADKQDACEAGSSRIWALDYNIKETNIESDASDYMTTNFGKFEPDTSVSPYTTMFVDYPGQLLSGTQVVRRPDCGIGCDVFELVAQTPKDQAITDQTKDTTPMKIERKTIDTGAGTSLAQVRFDSWSIVFQ